MAIPLCSICDCFTVVLFVEWSVCLKTYCCTVHSLQLSFISFMALPLRTTAASCEVIACPLQESYWRLLARTVIVSKKREILYRMFFRNCYSFGRVVNGFYGTRIIFHNFTLSANITDPSGVSTLSTVVWEGGCITLVDCMLAFYMYRWCFLRHPRWKHGNCYTPVRREIVADVSKYTVMYLHQNCWRSLNVAASRAEVCKSEQFRKFSKVMLLISPPKKSIKLFIKCIHECNVFVVVSLNCG
jgi:hypothetical protein